MNKRKWIGITAAAIALVPAWALAQPAPGSPGTASPLDAFSVIFGVDPSSISSLFLDANGSILATISALVNTAALTAVVITLMLTPLGSVLDVSQRRATTRWSIPWWIIRAVLALFFVTPTPAGYSPLQGMVMWTAMQGSDLADEAWARSVGYMATNLSIIPRVPTAGTHDLVQSMFESAVCAERLSALANHHRNAEDGANPVFGATVHSGANGYVDAMISREVVDEPVSLIERAWAGVQGAEVGGVKTTTTVSYDGSAQSGWGGSNEALCGSYAFEEKVRGQTGIMASNWRRQPLETLVQEVGQAAQQMVANPDTNTAQIREALANAEVKYAVAMQDVAENQLRAMVAGPTNSDGTSEEIANYLYSLDTSLQGGWFSAGAYYLTISRLSDAVAAQAQVTAKVVEPATASLSTAQAQDLAPWMARAKHVFDVGPTATSTFNSASGAIGLAGMGGQAPHEGSDDGGSSWFTSIKQKIEEHISKAFLELVDILPNKLATGRDPVVVLQSFGSFGLTTVEALFVAWPTIAHFTESEMAWPLMLAIIVPLFLAFAMLAYYLPAIPFILWIFGVFGWLMMLIEAVAVAPFWGAAHALPEGDGFAGQHAKQGYMLVISLIARPLLMLFGLFAGMVLIRFAVPMMTQLFFFWRSATWATQVIGIATTIFLLVLYAGLVLALIRACFSLIHMVPDRALRWIGHGVEQLGEAQNEHQSRSYMMAAYGVFRGAGGKMIDGSRRLAGPRKPSSNRARGK